MSFFQPGVGAPLAAAFLEQAIARGCRRFAVCGGAGALLPELVLGRVVVPTAGVRDEGTSYHYLPPSREIDADPAAMDVVTKLLTEHEVPFVKGKTWTTDGVYRETRTRTAKRRDEGCVVVEMEAAALLAVAQFRGVPLAYLLYAGDSLAGEQCDRPIVGLRGGPGHHPLRPDHDLLGRAAGPLSLPRGCRKTRSSLTIPP